MIFEIPPPSPIHLRDIDSTSSCMCQWKTVSTDKEYRARTTHCIGIIGRAVGSTGVDDGIHSYIRANLHTALSTLKTNLSSPGSLHHPLPGHPY